MLEFYGIGYELDGAKHIIPDPDRDLKTRTVQVEIRETVKRVIDVELPVDMKETAAEDIVCLMYDKAEVVLDGDDLVDLIEVNLV
jgi:hypothetical protein